MLPVLRRWLDSPAGAGSNLGPRPVSRNQSRAARARPGPPVAPPALRPPTAARLGGLLEEQAHAWPERLPAHSWGERHALPTPEFAPMWLSRCPPTSRSTACVGVMPSSTCPARRPAGERSSRHDALKRDCRRRRDRPTGCPRTSEEPVATSPAELASRRGCGLTPRRATAGRGTGAGRWTGWGRRPPLG
jgi:hypothetical protein